MKTAIAILLITMMLDNVPLKAQVKPFQFKAHTIEPHERLWKMLSDDFIFLYDQVMNIITSKGLSLQNPFIV